MARTYPRGMTETAGPPAPHAAAHPLATAKYGLPARFADAAAAVTLLVGREPATRVGIVIDADPTPVAPTA